MIQNEELDRNKASREYPDLVLAAAVTDVKVNCGRVNKESDQSGYDLKRDLKDETLKDKTLKDKTLMDKTLTDGTQKVAGSKQGCIYLEEDEDQLKAQTVSKRKKAKTATEIARRNFR